MKPICYIWLSTYFTDAKIVADKCEVPKGFKQ